MMENVTWEDVVAAEVGKVFVDRFDDGVRFLIMRGPFHLCAYVGCPISHPLAGLDYDSIPLACHGGLTFASAGGEGPFPKDFYWYGWDYGHCDDYMISESHSSSYAVMNERQTKWGVKEVEDDSYSAICEFRKMMRLAENIADKAVSHA
jgi:hypothetical protein